MECLVWVEVDMCAGDKGGSCVDVGGVVYEGYVFFSREVVASESHGDWGMKMIMACHGRVIRLEPFMHPLLPTTINMPLIHSKDRSVLNGLQKTKWIQA